MKKIILAISAIVILLSVNVALASTSSVSSPFTAIWLAIANIQQQIDNIQLIPGPEGPQGPQGEPGPQGEQGIEGPKGDTGNLPLGTLSSPAFDSGWIILPDYGAVIDVPHNVGGNINDYFIYATYRRPNGSFMSHQNEANVIWWEDVEPNNIQIVTNGDVTNLFDAARIQIWKISSSSLCGNAIIEPR